MNRRPWLAVAVYEREPVAVAPMATDMAANSDSTLRNSHGPRSPDPTSAASASTMWVCGVLGEAGAGGGGGRRGARGGGAAGRRLGGELRLDIEELARPEVAGPDERRERLDEVGLRRDRVGRDDLRPAAGHGLGDGTRAFELPT